MKSIFKKMVVKILTWEARLALRRYRPKIIAVTGSVGKTSAKDTIHTIISTKFHSRKSEKSFNSEIGVPLTILGLKNAWNNSFKWIWNLKLGLWRTFAYRNYPKILVLEVGADKPGDIQDIVSWLKPDISVLTALADIPVHVANFKSPEEVYEEKWKLLECLSSSGLALINGDDKRAEMSKRRSMGKTVFFGLGPQNSIMASNYSVLYDEMGSVLGLNFLLEYGGSTIPFKLIGGLGYGHMYAILAGVGTALSLGINLVDIADAAQKIKAPRGRMRLIAGRNGSQIIDDSYNSSPIATEMALRTLKDLSVRGRKIAALGDMRELGLFAEAEHKKIGKIVSSFVDILITVGPNAVFIAENAVRSGMIKSNVSSFTNSREAGQYLKKLLEKGDVVLVKGSQNTIRMEWLIEEIMAEPERKKELLVRQDREWERR